MKNYIYTLVFVLITVLGFAQNCQPVRDSREFMMIKNRILQQRGPAAFQASIEVAQVYCLSSLQAKDIASTLISERDKADFLIYAYPNITDVQNFFVTFDVFRSFGMAIQLYHQTMGQMMNTSNVIVPKPAPVPSYNGRSNCNNPSNKITFDNFMRTITPSMDSRNRAKNILNFTLNGCVTSQQAIQMASLISDENIRLDVLNRMIPNIFDLDNYSQATSILTTENQRNIFLQNLNGLNPNNNTICEMPEKDFRVFFQTVQKRSFDSDKISEINTSLEQRCLTSDQVKELITVSSFESTRLEIAKKMYDNCIDKQNYFKVNDNLKMSSSREDLNNYIQSRR
jgi:hypothetical protein